MWIQSITLTAKCTLNSKWMLLKQRKGHSCMIWWLQRSLSLFYLMAQILLSHNIKNNLPTTMSKRIVSILFVWLSVNFNQACHSHSLSSYWYPVINRRISNRSNTFHPEVVMAFECETAAVVDGWCVVVQSDEIGKIVGIILCQTFHFKLIQNKSWMPNTQPYWVRYSLTFPLKEHIIISHQSDQFC